MNRLPVTHRTFVVAILTILVAVGIIPSAVAGGSDPVAAISGTITNASTGSPLQDVLVEAIAHSGDTPLVVGSARSSADGGYSFTVPAGTYRFRATQTGYATSFFTEEGSEHVDITLSGRSDINFALDQFGSIHGVVADTNGAGISGVKVKAFADAAGDPVEQAVSDADGNYALTSLPSGTYLIQFDAAATDYTSLWWPKAATSTTATTIAVGAGATKIASATLAKGGKISGTITNSKGEPVSGAQVCASGTTYSWRCANADADGKYTIRGLDADQYTLSATAPQYLQTYLGNTFNSSLAQPVSLAESAELSGKNIALVDGVLVSGTVRTPTGPVGANVQVGCFSANWSTYASTDANGHYSCLLPEGELSLSAQLDEFPEVSFTPHTLRVGSPITDADILLSPAPPKSISGHITSGGITWSRSVVALDADDKVVASTYANWTGYYILRDLTPGSYTVQASSDGFATTCYGGPPCTPVTVTDSAATTGIDIALTTAATVTVSGRAVDLEGAPIADATFTVEGTPLATSDADGRFSAAVTGNRQVQFTLTKAGLSFWSEYVRLGKDDLSLGDIPLAPAGSISGTITSIDGAPVADQYVVLTADTPTDGYGPGYRSTYTDSSGHYSFSQLPPGHYYLSSMRGRVVQYYPNQYSVNSARAIDVSPGADVTADMELAKPASMSGVVHNADGTPASDTSVTLVDRSDATLTRYLKTDSGGEFTFGSLPPGTYAVEVNDQWWQDRPTESTANWITVAAGEAHSGLEFNLSDHPLISGGAISGTITDADHNPVAGQTVSAIPVGQSWSQYYQQTDSHGNFTILNLPSGEYRVAVDTDTMTMWAPGGWPNSATTWTVTAGLTTTVDMTIPATGIVRVTATDEHGAPLGAALTVYDASGQTELDTYWIDTDDPEVSLIAGTYQLEVSAAGYTPQRLTGVIVASQATVDVAQQLAPDPAVTTISGSMMFSGTPSSYYDIYLVDAHTGAVIDQQWSGDSPPTSTTPFAFKNVSPGDYLIAVDNDGTLAWYGGGDARTAAVVSVTAGVTPAPIEFTLPGAPPRTTVTLSGQVIVPAGVSLPADGFDSFELVLSGGPDDYDELWVTLDSTGHFSTTVPAGTYYLFCNSPIDQLVRYATKVTVSADTVYDIHMSTGGKVLGQVLNDLGQPLTNASVTAVDSSNQYKWATTDRNGHWEITGVAPGAAEVTVTRSGYLPAQVGSGTPVVVIDGESTATAAVRLVQAGRLSGRVLGSGGHRYVNLTLVDSDGKTLSQGGASEGGSFTFPDLAPGQVYLRINVDGSPTMWWPSAATRDLAEPLTITAGQGTTTSVTLPIVEADGTVTGTAVSQVGFTDQVTVTLSNADQTKVTSVEPGTGKFSLSAPAGKYHLSATVCLGLLFEDDECLGEARTTWYPASATEAGAEWITVQSGTALPSIDLVIGDGAEYTASPRPSISGQPFVGSKLQAETGSWTPAVEHFGYQWFRAGAAIPGAYQSTYTPTSQDIGSALTVRVTASTPGYRLTVVSSDPTTPIAVGALSTTAPTISGKAIVGSTLTAVSGTWNPQPDSVHYQWNRDGHPISGADRDRYTLVGEDEGKTITVTLTGVKTDYQDLAVTSDAVGPVERPAVGNISGVLHNAAGDPVPGASVSICHLTDETQDHCQVNTSASDGTFGLEALPVGTYAVRVSPPGDLIGRGTEATVTKDQTTQLSITLQAPEAPPAGASITAVDTAQGVPVVDYQTPLTLTVKNPCTGAASGTWTVLDDSGRTLRNGTFATTVGDLTAAVGTLYPYTGVGRVTSTISCEAGPETQSSFDLYVDPSGTVYDKYGNTVSGASVTLLESDAAEGDFTAVPDGSSLMSSGNRTNPDQTDADGRFRWDVVPGWYKVRASGCATTTSDAMEVPPAKVDLGIMLDCGTAPAATAAAKVAGGNSVGATLTATPAAFGDDIQPVAYQWRRDDTPIAGAVGSAYTIAAADQGHTVSLRISYRHAPIASNIGQATLTFAGFDLVTAGPAVAAAPPTVLPVVIQGSASISGKAAAINVVLTANTTGWGPAGTALSYQWLRGGAAIPGAVGSTYRVVAADAGLPIQVQVTGSLAGYTPAQATSAPTRKVPFLGKTKPAKPKVSGTAKVGKKLKAKPGTWKPSKMTFRYQWYRQGVAIPGATRASYTLTSADRGTRLTVTVTGTRPGYPTTARTSSRTQKVR